MKLYFAVDVDFFPIMLSCYFKQINRHEVKLKQFLFSLNEFELNKMKRVIKMLLTKIGFRSLQTYIIRFEWN